LEIAHPPNKALFLSNGEETETKSRLRRSPKGKKQRGKEWDITNHQEEVLVLCRRFRTLGVGGNQNGSKGSGLK